MGFQQQAPRYITDSGIFRRSGPQREQSLMLLRGKPHLGRPVAAERLKLPQGETEFRQRRVILILQYGAVCFHEPFIFIYRVAT